MSVTERDWGSPTACFTWMRYRVETWI